LVVTTVIVVYLTDRRLYVLDDIACFLFLAAFAQARQEWIGVANMSFARSVCGSATIGSKLFVVGGFDGERALDSVEVFDW
jgi:hypothetical protein